MDKCPGGQNGVPHHCPRTKYRKKMKRSEEISGTTLNAPTLAFQGSQKQKRERKDLKKYLKR